MKVHARSMMRAVAIVAVALAGIVTAAAATSATPSPAPSETLTYEGDLTLTPEGSESFSVFAQLTVDCTEEPCTALVDITGDFVASPTNGQALPVVDGAVSQALPDFGDLCVLKWIGAGDLTIGFEDDTASVTRTSRGISGLDCGGSEAEASAAVLSGVLALVGGDDCVVTGTCPSPSPSPTPSETPSPSPSASVAPPTEAPTTTDPSGREPSVLSSLDTIDDAVTAESAALAAAGALVLVLILAFPSTMLDSVAEHVTDALDRRRERRGLAAREPSDRPPLGVIGWPAATAGLVIAALASAYVEPDFGPDLLGLRTTIGVLVAFLVVIAGGWAFAWVVIRLASGDTLPRIEFRPLTLLVVAAAVFFSRITGFEPGIVFGLVAGIGFAAVVRDVVRARASVLLVTWMVAVAVAAWWGYGEVAAGAGAEPTFMDLLALETLAAVAISGLSALPLALLPVRGMPGSDVFRWNRWVWGLLYTIGLAGFFLALLPLPDSWERIDMPVAAWFGLYAVYTAVALVLWLVVARPWQREPATAADTST